MSSGNDLPQIVERGLWHGFDLAAVIAVVSSALGGLIVAAVLKCALATRVSGGAHNRRLIPGVFAWQVC